MTSSDLNIRRATPADAAEIFALHVGSIHAYCAPHYTAEQIAAWVGPKRPENYVRAMEAGEAIFVAQDGGGAMVGFGSIDGDEINAVYVAAGHAGQGVGAALLAELEAHARRTGIRTIRLRSSVNAVGFYERHGYRQDGPGSFGAGGIQIPCIAMSKSLGAD